jgi:hypothetical protein
MMKKLIGLAGVTAFALTLVVAQMAAQAPAAAQQGGGVFTPPEGQGGGGRGGAGGGQGRGGGGAPAAPAGPIVRGEDGKPNLTGFWNSGLRTNIEARGSIVEPEGGVVPYKPDWKVRADEMRAKGMFNEPEAHCLPGGVPRNFGLQMGFQLVHGKDHLALAWDTVGATRLIYFDQGRKHVPTEARTHQGDSLARWEGDVLVVETTSQVGHTWFDVEGHIHSDQLHVVERWTPVNANSITYEAIVTDPVALTQPMKVANTFTRNLTVPPVFRTRPTGYEQIETACVEGERDLNLYTQSGGGFATDREAGANAPPGAVSAGRGGGGGGRGGAAAPAGAPGAGAPGGAPAGGGRGRGGAGAPPAGGGQPQ